MRLACCLLLAAAAVAEEAPLYESEHYALYAEGPPAEAEEMSSVLEAAWHEFKKYFGGKPKVKKGDKLVVRYFLEGERFRAAVAKTGSPPLGEGVGGYYWPGTKEVFLYKQPTRYYTRVLLIHEAGHQFHYLARTRNKAPAAEWYIEGVAEFVGWHHWDGVNLQIGVMPMVSLKDYAAAALAEANAPDFDFEALVAGKAKPSRAFAWSLYRWLATGGPGGEPQKKWKAFHRKMDGGVSPGSIFRKNFGAPKTAVNEYRAWLSDNQQPFEWVFNEWDSLGNGRVRGFSKDRLTICRLKRAAENFEATLEPEKGQRAWNGGVVLHYEDPKNYSFALINPAGFVQIARYIDGRLKTMERGPVPAMEKGTAYKLQLFRRGGNVFMSVDKTGFGPWELPGNHFGLAVQRSDLKFRDITWR